ncbi:MAG: 4-hydroxy-tetrahydrodipicolinate reductase [Candidatus Aegiribacteria sp.]|nr:4-hydroxy-tetrahydrodipicolinate reductase [Candidatus Aegiribacteria sp.]
MKICVFGSEGRMGRLVREEAGSSIIACYDITTPGNSVDGKLPPEVDTVIDFTLPSAWEDLDKLLQGNTAGLVSGTTGLGNAEMELLRKWSSVRPVFFSSNMSMGIFVLGRLLQTAASMLADDFDLEIVEFHHSGKIDSPSGTALTLLNIWEKNGGGKKITYGRSGPAGPRSPDETGIHSVRGGDIVGDHQLYLLGDGEKLLLSHSATGRRTFAIGALKAADFIFGKPPGLYSMEDMMSKRDEK